MFGTLAGKYPNILADILVRIISSINFDILPDWHDILTPHVALILTSFKAYVRARACPDWPAVRPLVWVRVCTD